MLWSKGLAALATTDKSQFKLATMRKSKRYIFWVYLKPIIDAGKEAGIS
jgi:hypothetical protein